MQKNKNPFRREEPATREYNMEIVIDELEEGSGVGGGVANFLSGHALFRGEKFPFDAVAYGRIGGQNVSPNLTIDAIKRLNEMGVDSERFVAQLQRKLVEGEITLNSSKRSPPPDVSSETS